MWDPGSPSGAGAATGKELARLGHDGVVNAAAFSADGLSIITASDDKAARLWRAFPTTQHLVNAAKERLRRCLTPKQRAQYFLPAAPPLWCVERRLFPYHGDAWQTWLAARKQGHDAPLPTAAPAQK